MDFPPVNILIATEKMNFELRFCKLLHKTSIVDRRLNSQLDTQSYTQQGTYQGLDIGARQLAKNGSNLAVTGNNFSLTLADILRHITLVYPLFIQQGQEKSYSDSIFSYLIVCRRLCS